MKQKIIQSLGMALSSLVLLGCGGSSDNNDDPKVTLTGTGYYVDSPVAGVEYVCGTKSGTTNTTGEFVFDIGSGCTFKVAGVTLRETASDKLKDKVTIFENNETVARFLQSIDNDGNTSNGIQIDAKILTILTDALKSDSANRVPKDTETLNNVVNKIKDIPEFKGEVKSEEEVRTHLDRTEGTLFKDEIAGKTLYHIDNELIKEIKFNADMTTLTITTVIGSDTEGNGEHPIKYENNKLILLDDDNKYMTLNHKTIDYLLLDFYSPDGIKKDDGRFYFDKAKAEASLSGGSTPSTDTPSDINIVSLLAGKTFYRVLENKIEATSFSADMTTMTYENVYGAELGNTGTKPISVSDNKVIVEGSDIFWITEDNVDYILLGDYNSIEKSYKDLEKAKAYYESRKIDSTTTDNILKELLSGNTFYFNDGGLIKSIAFTNDASSLTVTTIQGTDTDGNGAISCQVIDNKLILIDEGNKYSLFVSSEDKYLLFDNYSADGVLAESGMRFYFNQTDAEALVTTSNTADINISILAGKTIYYVSEVMVESDTFSADMTSVTWENIYGVGDSNKVLGDTGTSYFHLEDNEVVFDNGGHFHIQEMTDTFVIFWDGTKSMKYYLNLDEAKAYYESITTTNTPSTGTDFKAELAGKTFYLNDNGSIKSMVFNNDVTSLTITTIQGTDTDGNGVESCQVIGDNFSIGGDFMYSLVLFDKYILFDNDIRDGILMESDMKFYFNQADAESFSTTPTISNISPSILAGKTLYFVSEFMIESDTFNTNMTSVTWENVYGVGDSNQPLGATGATSFYVENNMALFDYGVYFTIQEESDTFVILWNGRNSIKFYFDLDEAKAVYESMTPPIDTEFKDEIAGKTFYILDEDDGVSIIKTVIFNNDLTTISGTKIDGTKSISYVDNKIVLLDEDNKYMSFNQKTIDYLLLDFYSPDGIKEDEGKFYFDKAKAESSNSDSSTPSTDTPSNINIVDLVAGKTVYRVLEHIIESSTYNADMTEMTWENVYGDGQVGQELGNKGTVSISVSNNKVIIDGKAFWVIEDNPDYIVGNDTIKSYKDLEKAKAVYESMKSGSEPADLSSGTYVQDDNTINISKSSLNMNHSNPPILQFNLYYNGEKGDVVQINTIYKSKEEFDSKFSNNSLTIDSNNGSVGMEIAGQGWVGNDSVSSDFQVEVIKNSDGTYNLTSKGHFISSGRTIKDINVINILSKEEGTPKFTDESLSGKTLVTYKPKDNGQPSGCWTFNSDKSLTTVFNKNGQEQTYNSTDANWHTLEDGKLTFITGVSNYQIWELTAENGEVFTYTNNWYEGNDTLYDTDSREFKVMSTCPTAELIDD